MASVCTFEEEITKPIDSLDDLLDWKPSSVSRCLIGNPLNNNVGVGDKERRVRTLVCHDMAGGYLEDRFAHGSVAESVYYLREWPYMDIFVYFSHHFVTIPPVGWINAAHTHNVPVLGTFITEWAPGEQICADFLSDGNKLVSVVDQLAQIASTYKFDGWLINIENPINHVENLISFVGLLTAKCKEVIGERAFVIWYDSVTVDGTLKWQDALNEMNKRYFDVCDGIFLNYGWDDEKLEISVTNAGERILDVYVGLDVFGRGCMGGGGYKSYQALNCIRQRGLSVALFAPGWVFECLDKEKFEENQRLYWSLLAPGLRCKKLVRLPFSTCFVPGKRWYPPRVAVEGPDVARCFFCLRDQEMQPHWFCPRDETWPTNKSSVFPSALTYLAHHYAPDQPGGAVLKTTSKETDAKLRLFCCDLKLDQPIHVSMTYQAKATDVLIGLALSTRGDQDKSSVYLMPHMLNADRIRAIFPPPIHLSYCLTSTTAIRQDVLTMVADILIPKEDTLKAIDLLILSLSSAPVDCLIQSLSIRYSVAK